MQISDMVEYQANSIVSRTIIDKPTGTLTLFAFDAGQALSEHTAPFDAVVHIIDGEAAVTIAGELHTVKTGEMLVMPANKPHALKANRRFKMMLIMIHS